MILIVKILEIYYYLQKYEVNDPNRKDIKQIFIYNFFVMRHWTSAYSCKSYLSPDTAPLIAQFCTW